ncbi:MAG: GNAT family N-acetyltransferase, partial [Anaerolineaceae bacterium]|nr:GNAT family N-acetyltransferase [Anaerolineaceae bacterium]
MKPENEVEETLASGLKYTEETNRSMRSLPMRDCFLWQAGAEEPISGLNVVSFRQRFGAAAIPAEGIGGVETLPAFRRRGHMGTLLTQVIASISKRVPVAFVSDAIEDAYEQLGFVNCLAESYLSLRVQHVERMTNRISGSPALRVRAFSPEDLPAMIRLYNQAHIQRSWTHERHAGWNRLNVAQTWQPGSAVIILEQEEQIAGYAIFTEPQFGHPAHSFIIDELTAADPAAAQALLVELG